MSKSIPIYPMTIADFYWRDTATRSGDPVSRAGSTSENTYLWPIPFDLSAYKNKIMRGLKLKARMTSESNNFTGTEVLGAGLSLYNNSSVNAAGHSDLGNAHLPVTTGEMRNEWDISSAWGTLKQGLAYIVLYGNEYGVLYNNSSSVAQANRPYIELVYDEPVYVYNGSTWQTAKDIQVYNGSAWQSANGLKVFADGAWKTVF